MKLTATKFLASVTEQCLDWFSPFNILFSMVALTMLFFGLALLYKALVVPCGWWHRLRLARSHGREDAPYNH